MRICRKVVSTILLGATAQCSLGCSLSGELLLYKPKVIGKAYGS